MDVTGDGINDIVSGSYWSNDENCPDGNPQAGYVYLLVGKGNGDFEPATPLRNVAGQPVTNVPLSREKLENYATDDIEWANICTTGHLADYDADGDLDLIAGSMHNSIFIHINHAKDPQSAPAFDELPKKLSILLPDMHSDPHLFDWDQDGDLDIVSGSESGSVYLSVNAGTAEKPDFQEFQRLVHVDASYQQTTDDGQTIQPGRNARVWVDDVNHDGKMDLLVGDSTTIENSIPGLSDEEAARMKSEYQSEIGPINEKRQAIYSQFEKDMKKVAENQQAAEKLQEKLQKDLIPLNEEMMTVREKEKRFVDRTSTGHVWLYLQK